MTIPLLILRRGFWCLIVSYVTLQGVFTKHPLLFIKIMENFVPINPATKLQCKYKHYSIRRPRSRWSNSGNNKILSFNCQTCIHNKRNLNYRNSKISNRINNFFLWNIVMVIPRILLDPCSLSSLL